jgi:hypothetical protein
VPWGDGLGMGAGKCGGFLQTNLSCDECELGHFLAGFLPHRGLVKLHLHPRLFERLGEVQRTNLFLSWNQSSYIRFCLLLVMSFFHWHNGYDNIVLQEKPR